MSLGRYRPWGQSQEKIRPGHRDRAAVVYVRQSSRQQVLEHSESTRLQYALAERAVALGWARSRIVVIDDDLGVSAATADARAGFARLVTSFWSCARCPGCCWPIRTVFMIRGL